MRPEITAVNLRKTDRNILKIAAARRGITMMDLLAQIIKDALGNGDEASLGLHNRTSHN